VRSSSARATCARCDRRQCERHARERRASVMRARCDRRQRRQRERRARGAIVVSASDVRARCDRRQHEQRARGAIVVSASDVRASSARATCERGASVVSTSDVRARCERRQRERRASVVSVSDVRASQVEVPQRPASEPRRPEPRTCWTCRACVRDGPTSTTLPSSDRTITNGPPARSRKSLSWRSAVWAGRRVSLDSSRWSAGDHDAARHGSTPSSPRRDRDSAPPGATQRRRR